jgi:hypothetical protein
MFDIFGEGQYALKMLFAFIVVFGLWRSPCGLRAGSAASGFQRQYARGVSRASPSSTRRRLTAPAPHSDPS